MRRLLAGNPAPWPKSGTSEFSTVDLGGTRVLATIEPWHGNQVVIYREIGGTWERNVIDIEVGLGHRITAADLDGDGSQEFIVADRSDVRGVYIYTALDGEGRSWRKEVLNDDMEASGCDAADLNGDARIDIVCIGRATEDLKWFENTLE